MWLEEHYEISRSDFKMNPRKMAGLNNKCTCRFGRYCQAPFHKKLLECTADFCNFRGENVM